MTEKTKKILAVSVGGALCCALTVGIGLRFGGEKITQTEPNLPTESHAEVTVEPLTEIQIVEEKEVEKPTVSSSVEESKVTQQQLQPEPTKPPKPEKPTITQLPKNHTEDDVPESERNLDEPPAYEPEQLVVTTPETEPAMGETADTGTYIEGFGWVESGSETAVVEADDMTENGNKIGMID